MKLSEIPIRTDQEVKVVIDGEFDVFALVGKFAEAGKKNIAYLSDAAFLDSFLAAKVDCVICTEKVFPALKDVYDGGICISSDPKTTFFAAHEVLAEVMSFEKTRIGEHTTIHPTAVVSEEGVVIGNHVTIGAHAVIKPGVTIEDHVVIKEACLVGTSPFYYFGNGENRRLVTPTGGLVIQKGAQLHGHVVIEKGALGGNTIIGPYTMVDNRALIEHDNILGENCTICGGTSFAGWVKVGDRTFVGVAASVVPGMEIGSDCMISAGAVVTKNVPDGTQVSGNFAIEHSRFLSHLKEMK